MNLKLERPLAFFDIESTGINRRSDRIIDLAIVKLLPDGSQASFTFRVNPEMPIPPASTEIHGITDADVKDSPTFRQVIGEVAACLEGCDLAGYNILGFDIPLLEEEFRRAGGAFDVKGRRIVDAQRIFHQKEPRDLTAALKFYCGEFHLGAHGAMEDVLATMRVLEGELGRYKDLPADVAGLNEVCNPKDPDWADASGKLRWDADGDVTINFGQYQGRKLKELAEKERKFLEWILRKDFPRDTEQLVRDALEGKLARREAVTKERTNNA